VGADGGVGRGGGAIHACNKTRHSWSFC
jgi:hypothetical protein